MLWDTFSMVLTMENGSIATILYGSGGDSALAKERIEIHCGGRSAIIDDFQRVELWHAGRVTKKARGSQDKGQKLQVQAWVDGLRNGSSPIPLAEILNVHAACLAALRSMQTRATIRL